MGSKELTLDCRARVIHGIDSFQCWVTKLTHRLKHPANGNISKNTTATEASVELDAGPCPPATASRPAGEASDAAVVSNVDASHMSLSDLRTALCDQCGLALSSFSPEFD